MAIAENSYPPKMGSSCLQILYPKIWLSSEISDPKTRYAHPRMQICQNGTTLRSLCFVSINSNCLHPSRPGNSRGKLFDPSNPSHPSNFFVEFPGHAPNLGSSLRFIPSAFCFFPAIFMLSTVSGGHFLERVTGVRHFIGPIFRLLRPL